MTLVPWCYVTSRNFRCGTGHRHILRPLETQCISRVIILPGTQFWKIKLYTPSECQCISVYSDDISPGPGYFNQEQNSFYTNFLKDITKYTRILVFEAQVTIV